MPGVSTTLKHSLLNDTENLIQRVSRVLEGRDKFLDLNVKRGLAALRSLREVHALLAEGLIPTNRE